jgi:hypothetical protein
MTYAECYEFISIYCNDMLPLFADGWSRFPAEPNKSIIIKRLEQKQAFYSTNKDFHAVASGCGNVIDTLRKAGI